MEHYNYTILFRENGIQYEWGYNKIGEFQQGLHEIYNCISCRIEEVTVYGQEVEQYTDYL